GVLSVNSSSRLGNAGASNGLTFNGGTLKATGPIASSGRNVTMAGAGTIDAGDAVSLGDFSGAGSLTKTGSAALTIKSANIGNLTVNAGTLALAANGTAAGVA